MATAGPTRTEDDPAASRDAWLRTRTYLNAHRHELTDAALRDFKPEDFIPGTRLLTRPGWIPDHPVPLEGVRLAWSPEAPATPISGDAAELDHIRPLGDDGTPYRRYADAVERLARPRLFENRACYRLLDVGGSADRPSLTFGVGAYFDVIDICEAAAHEFTASHLDGQAIEAATTPFRTAVGDPTDLARRPVMAATSTMTIRLDRATGDAEFVLHWRDPAKVASGGGLYQVMPVGMFQPSHDAPWNQANDFDLWRSISRELSEELLGSTEDYGSGAHPIDYNSWDFHRDLGYAREQGRLRVFWLGLGMDPLTYVTDMLAVAVFDADLFDRTFQRLVATNDEGHRVELEDGTGRASGIPFRADQIMRLTHDEPMQPAGAALLHLAWKHRAQLLR
ncbi:helix-turn-helix domain-containing protein [Kitasatospora sp. HPMI-4]|uniref:helix-turn-helix domain-containing protein n=1 Tax=Kitasatospora sp. HPMI-4 TaxID=3448443 RepID=UPI003F1DD337